MKIITTIAIIIATLVATTAFTYTTDVNYIYMSSTNTLIVIPKKDQSLASVCNDALALGYETNNILAMQSNGDKAVYVWCKYD